MKKLFSLLGALLLLAVPLMFTSCDDVPDNPVKPTPTPKAPTYRNDNYRPLTFEATKANITVTFKISGSNIAPSSVEYSLDKGATWTPLSSANQAILLANVGDMVMFRGNNASYNGEAQFVIASAASEARGGTRQLTMSDKLANAIGNIYSLVFGKSISGSIKLTAENANALKNILKDCPIDAISDDGARRLVASSRNLAPGVLEGFLSGTLITEAPDLRASVMEKDCYKDAFKDCPYVAKVTMLATKCADGLDPIDCLSGWMDNSGGEVPTGDDKIVILNQNAEASFLNKIEDQLPPGDTWEIVDTKGEEIETGASETQYIAYDAEGTKSIKDIPEDAIELTGAIETPLSGGVYVVKGEATCAGDLTMSGDVSLILCDGGSLTVNDGGVYGGSGESQGGLYAITIYGQEKNSGELVVNYTDDGDTAGTFQGKAISIHGGTVKINSMVGQGFESDGEINIYGGIISISGGANGFFAMGGLNIYGGNVTVSTIGDAIRVYGSSSDLKITGGEVTAKSTTGNGISQTDEDDGHDGSITISGGKVIAKSSDRMEGILASDKIVISGGTVEATGGDGGGVGLEAYSITISGTAEVTAIGGIGIPMAGFKNGGAGIEGELTVNGGTIIAKGGNGADSSDGFGGNGGNGINSNFEITGGSVTATGGNGGYTTSTQYSVDYGMGGHGIKGMITVSGGTVTAKGGNGGSGTTYGQNGGCGILGTVNGATNAPDGVTATGGTAGTGGTEDGVNGGDIVNPATADSEEEED